MLKVFPKVIDMHRIPPSRIVGDPLDSHWHIEAIISGMRQRLAAGWTVDQTLSDLERLGAEPSDLYFCLEAVKILKVDKEGATSF